MKADTIKRYIFVNTVLAFDFSENSCHSQNNTNVKCGIIIGYGEFLKAAMMEVGYNYCHINIFQKKIRYEDLPNSSILGFHQIETSTQSKTEEKAILLHLNKKMMLISLEYSDFNFTIEK
jgi:hypothetical protein